MKALTDSQIAFKAATRRAVLLAGGPNAASEVTRAAASLLSRYGNADHPEFAPVDICFALDRAADDHVILRAWADMCGFDVIPRNVDNTVAGDLVAAAGDTALEAGQLVNTLLDAAKDGNVSNSEGRSVLEAAAEAKSTITRIEDYTRRAMVK